MYAVCHIALYMSYNYTCGYCSIIMNCAHALIMIPPCYVHIYISSRRLNTNQFNLPEEVFFPKKKLAASGGIRTHDGMVAVLHSDPRNGQT